MAFIGILLLLTGVAGIGAGMVAFGDIGISCLIAGIGALLSGFGLLLANGKIKKL